VRRRSGQAGHSAELCRVGSEWIDCIIPIPLHVL
jgi:hypothetical protein